ncbi:MAG: ABC transporter permease [Candidatus Wallbacteria bacterium]|nr:ABC transporter permease [Candidatus Wallbacteria bacterium]
MRTPPLVYNFYSLLVRWPSTLLTTASIGSTVAVIAGVMALQQGFASLYELGGRDDILVFLRPGATSEGESAFPKDRARIVMMETPEILFDKAGWPMAAGELYLAVRRAKEDGGETNVPIRGVPQTSLTLSAPRLQILEGRAFAAGRDEVMVGKSLVGRIQHCRLGDTIRINATGFKVVGIFSYDGPFQSEIWGDIDRLGQVLHRPTLSRVVARARPGADVAALAKRLESDKRVPVKVMTEKEYLESQTKAISWTLWLLGSFLAVVMGTGAVFTGTNSMLAMVAARTHEIGILVTLGFRPVAIFSSFVMESIFLGLAGGALGCLLVLPLHGMSTGTTNFQTFTEVAFAFQVRPIVLVTAVGLATVLGLLGGLFPAWRAASAKPVDVLRRV